MAVLSPYVAEVSERLRGVLADQGISTPVFGSFDVAEEAAVARIDSPSIIAASETLMSGAGVDGLFLSCTNLRTLDVVADLEQRLAKPVLTSNLVLAWHMMRLGELAPAPGVPGRLFADGFRPESDSDAQLPADGNRVFSPKGGHIEVNGAGNIVTNLTMA